VANKQGLYKKPSRTPRSYYRRKRHIWLVTLVHLTERLDLFFFQVSWGGLIPRPLGTSATNWPIIPAPDMIYNECGTVGGIRIGKGNRSTRRKPLPVPLSPQQIPYDLTWARTRLGLTLLLMIEKGRSLVGTRRWLMSTIKWHYILPLKILERNRPSRWRSLE
jgi:hypothetical protein